MKARIIPVTLFLLIVLPARAYGDLGNNNTQQTTDNMASGLMSLAGRGAAAAANAAAMGAASQLGISQPDEPEDDGGASDGDGGGDGGGEGAGDGGGGDD